MEDNMHKHPRKSRDKTAPPHLPQTRTEGTRPRLKIRPLGLYLAAQVNAVGTAVLLPERRAIGLVPVQHPRLWVVVGAVPWRPKRCSRQVGRKDATPGTHPPAKHQQSQQRTQGPAQCTAHSAQRTAHRAQGQTGTQTVQLIGGEINKRQPVVLGNRIILPEQVTALTRARARRNRRDRSGCHGRATKRQKTPAVV